MQFRLIILTPRLKIGSQSPCTHLKMKFFVCFDRVYDDTIFFKYENKYRKNDCIKIHGFLAFKLKRDVKSKAFCPKNKNIFWKHAIKWQF